ncbi:MAG TPA: hypothetical protein VF192_15435 [Longimicrobiales bacterium]
MVLDFHDLPLWLNLAVFAATAAAVWFTGTRLTRQVEAIAQRTGAGRAIAGLLLLGGVVSLPELSTAVAAASAGNARFAVNTLLGGIAATMVVIAVIDAVVREPPLSTDITHPVVLLQGTLSVLFLVVTAAGIVVGDLGILGAGVWTVALLALYLFFANLVRHYEWHRAWIPEEDVRRRGTRAARADAAPGPEQRSRPPRRDRRPLRGLILATAAVALATAAAGFLLSRIGDAIAGQTGLGASFTGLLLGGIVTSLPEASTVHAAVRIRRFELAFSDAYGSNLFSTMAIFAADLAYPGGPILNEVGRFGLFAVLLGAAVSAIFLAGCLERRNRSILGMGLDSLIVLCVYVGGLVLLYHLR